MAVVQMSDELAYEAAERGDVAGLEAILKQHPEQLNAIPNGRTHTPLLVAVFFAMVECVELLLRYGADPNNRTSDSFESSCLANVIWSDDYERGSTRAMVAHMLIDAGADVTAKCSNRDPVPPLEYARRANCKRVQLIQVLEEYDSISYSLVGDLFTRLKEGSYEVYYVRSTQHSINGLYFARLNSVRLLRDASVVVTAEGTTLSWRR